MKKLRLAVAGAGVIGRRHLQLIRAHPACDLMAIADPMPAAAALAVAYEAMPATALMAAPFVLLAVNLAAGIVAQPRFPADLPLLVEARAEYAALK